MKKQVKLNEIIDVMETQFEGTSTYLNLKTYEVVSVSGDDMRIAEDEESFDHLPEWQQKDIQIAIDVLENFEDYLEIPTKFEISEYNMMEQFIDNLNDQKKKSELFNSIQGKGAFRRFKDKLYDLEIHDEWYTYRAEGFKQIALEWCNDNDIQCIE
ncbi:UPF0158 family protein [Chengkuizengella sediminis]|uniref:UPF0158 family protein n=1 Tax=Chengkuizengella sediminis TaxID=1885917 RepID=UPI00138A0787|nr:UPF0158 family protein [Chengkuizengella sediminis]NDI33911.1 hypothetical protein [Chengkuizengella sediminis]